MEPKFNAEVTKMLTTLQKTHDSMNQILGYIASQLEILEQTEDTESRLDYEDAMESATAVAMNVESLIAEFRRIHTPTTGV